MEFEREFGKSRIESGGLARARRADNRCTNLWTVTVPTSRVEWPTRRVTYDTCRRWVLL